MHQRSIRVVGLVALVAVLPALGDAPAPIEGLWLTDKGEARIRIDACGPDELCGTLAWIRDPPDGEPALDVNNPDPALRERKVLGLTLLRGLPAEPDEDGVYRGGRIYDPQSGRTYRCRVELTGEGQLALRGFVGFSLLGRTTHWTRMEPERVSGGTR